MHSEALSESTQTPFENALRVHVRMHAESTLDSKNAFLMHSEFTPACIANHSGGTQILVGMQLELLSECIQNPHRDALRVHGNMHPDVFVENNSGLMFICIHNPLHHTLRTHHQHLDGTVLQYDVRMHP